MLKKLFFAVALASALCTSALAQSTNATKKPSTSTTQPAQSDSQPATRARATTTQRTTSTAEAAEERAVREAFDSLVDGIRRADADAVMKLFWNSPRLVLFNNNGSVTKTWEQARSNRQSLYSKVKDVKLDVRDVHVKALGPAAALVTCLWDQTQTADGQPEHATGRLTIVYQKFGADWKIVHTHTSPDKPNPSNILPSERTNDADSTTAKPPAKP